MNKVVLTGSSGSIGQNLSKLFLESNYNVLGISRNHPEFLKKNQNYQAVSLDLSDLSEVEKKSKILAKEYGESTSVIVCNAGVGYFGELEQLTYSQIKETFFVNIISHVILVKHFIPYLKKRKNGRVIFIGSDASLKGDKKGSIYCASKFAMRGFSQSLRQECKSNNIPVTIINAGMIKSSFYDDKNFSPGGERRQHLDPEDIALTIKQLLQTPSHVVCEEVNIQPIVKVINKK